MVPIITYRPLSSLQPIELRYEYQYNEKLNTTNNQYAGGLRVKSIKAFDKFQDVSLNKGNGLVLTDMVSLSDVFIGEDKNPNIIQGTVILQLETSSSYFMTEETVTGRVTISRTPSFIHASAVQNTQDVELLINGKYLQVEDVYPYTVYLSETALINDEIYRQQFTVERNKNNLRFRSKTVEGYRYLAFNNDDILRATGTILNNTVLNNYNFNVVEVTEQAYSRGFIPKTGIVSYFMSFQDKKYNKNVTVRERVNVKTNLLASFSIHEAVINGTANINLANLRTNYTPEGTPLSIPLTSTFVPDMDIPTIPGSPEKPPLPPPPPIPEVVPDNTLLKEDNLPLVQENKYYIELE